MEQQGDPLKDLQLKFHEKKGIPVSPEATLDDFKQKIIADPEFRQQVKDTTVPDLDDGDWYNVLYEMTGQRLRYSTDPIYSKKKSPGEPESGTSSSLSAKGEVDDNTRLDQIQGMLDQGQLPSSIERAIMEASTVDDSNARPALIEIGPEETKKLVDIMEPERFDTPEAYRANYDSSMVMDKSRAGELKDVSDALNAAPIVSKLRPFIRMIGANPASESANAVIDEVSKPEVAARSAEAETIMLHQNALLHRMQTINNAYKDKKLEKDDPNYVAFNTAYQLYEQNNERLESLPEKYPLADVLMKYRENSQKEYDEFYKSLSPRGKAIANVTSVLKNAAVKMKDDPIDILAAGFGIADPEFTEAYFGSKGMELLPGKSTSLQQRPIREKVVSYNDYLLGVEDGEVTTIYDKDGYKADLTAEQMDEIIESAKSDNVDLSKAKKGFISGSFLYNGMQLTADMFTTMGYTGAASKILKGMKFAGTPRQAIIPSVTYQYSNEFAKDWIDAGGDGRGALAYGLMMGSLSGAISSLVPVEAGVNKLPFLRASRNISLKSIQQGQLTTAARMKASYDATKRGLSALIGESVEENLDELANTQVNKLINAQFDDLSLGEDFDPIETAALSFFASMGPTVTNTVADIISTGSSAEYKQMLLDAVKNKEKFDAIADSIHEDTEEASKAKDIVAGIIDGREEFFESKRVPEGQKMDFAYNQQLINKAEEMGVDDEAVAIAKVENEIIYNAYQKNLSEEVEKNVGETGTYEDPTEQDETTETDGGKAGGKVGNFTKKPKEKKSEKKPEKEPKKSDLTVDDLVDETEVDEDAVDAFRINPRQLSTDLGRFQPRKLDEVKLQNLVDNWDDSKQDPIEIWKDPEDGKFYVLSGHHRRDGAIMARRKNVKVIEFKGTEAEAIERATFSNFRNKNHTVFDNANMFRQFREEKNKEGRDKLRTELDRNARFTENVSYLNPDGKTLDTLRATFNNKDKASQNKIESVADWIGEVRKKYKDKLTDQHENEMYDFLMGDQKKYNTKAKFQEVIGQLTSTTDWKPESSVLNLKRLQYKSDAERKYDEEAQRLTSEIKSRQEKIKQFEARLTDVNNPGYLDPDDPNYDSMKSQLDKKTTALNTEIKALQKDLMKHKQSKGDFVRAGMKAESNNLFSGLQKDKDEKQNDSEGVSKTDGNEGKKEKATEEVSGGPEPKAEVKPRVEKTKAKSYGAKNKLVKRDAYEAARQRFRNKLGSNPFLDPEALTDATVMATFHIEAGVREFSEFAKLMIEDMGEGARNYLKNAYNNARDSMEDAGLDISDMTPYQDVRKADLDNIINELNQENESNNLESGVQGTSGKDQVQKKSQALPNESRASKPGVSKGKPRTGESGVSSNRGESVPGSAATSGGSSNKGITVKLPPDDGGVSGGTNLFDAAGVEVDEPARKPADSFNSEPAPISPSSLEEKRKAQADATKEVKWGDRQNIADALPFLFDGQLDDVKKAEDRLIEKNEKGIMFTNGTGTGKTYTGGGIAKRFWNDGRRDIFIVVPTQEKVKDWIGDLANLGLPAKALKDIKDNGTRENIRITTYSNFYQNEAILDVQPDLVLYDESHYLGSNQQGDETTASIQNKNFTYAPNQARTRIKKQNQPRYDAIDEKYFNERIRTGHELRSMNPQAWEQREAERKEVAADIDRQIQEAIDKSKVVFLSATPFAYRKNVIYADGYLWNLYQDRDSKDDKFHGYNEPNKYESFMVEHFGYRMRYNKLTTPGAEVNMELMEQSFADKMFKQGVMSYRGIEVEPDYSRQFIQISDPDAQKVEEAYEAMKEARDEENHPKYPLLEKAFDYLTRQKILEAVKAKEAVQRARQHIELGRKVVVFHNFNVGYTGNPFAFEEVSIYTSAGEINPEKVEYNRQVAEWREEFPQYYNMQIDIDSPLNTFTNNFSEQELRLFNGRMKKSEKRQAVPDFNNDPDVKVLLVNKLAGKEGISLHDKVGDTPRALIQLGLPNRPTDLTQIEGRIYRIGVKSNAVQEILTTNLGFEQSAFTHTISQRASTAENIGVGSKARALKKNIVQGYLESEAVPPSLEQGTGGKEHDKRVDQATPLDMAKALYYGNLKKTSKTKAKEGIDYFATPEPTGFSIMKMLKLDDGESFMEPSAGHGAIARFASSQTKNVFVEPSYKLSSKLGLNTMGNGKIEETRFEDYNIINKFDGIAMNPPFGTGGKTAIEHLAKAWDHLNDRGRLIAVIPDGPSMEKRFDKWMNQEPEKGDYSKKLPMFNARIIAEIRMPSITFERAGTSVGTKIYVIDKYNPVKGEDTPYAPHIKQDLTYITDINELFETFDSIADSIPGRESQKTNVFDSVAPTVKLYTVPHKWKDKEYLLVKGPTFEHKDALRNIEGSYWNKWEKAWSFPIENREAVESAISKINESRVLEDPEAEYESARNAILSKEYETVRKEINDQDIYTELQMDPIGQSIANLIDRGFAVIRSLGRVRYRDVVDFFGFHHRNLHRRWRNFLSKFRRSDDDNILRRDHTFRESLRYFLQDKYVTLNKVVKRLDPKGERPGHMAYIMNEMWRSKASDLRSEMEKRIVGRPWSELGATKGTKSNDKSLFGRLKKEGGDLNKFYDFIYAQHAPERNERIRQMYDFKRQKEIDDLIDSIEDPVVLQDAIDGINLHYDEITPQAGSGMTDSEAEAIMDDLSPEQTELYERYAQEFRDTVVKGRIDLLEEGGVITPEVATQMRNGTREGFEKFDYYIPMMVKPEFLPQEDVDIDTEYAISPQIKSLVGTDKYTKDQRYNPVLMGLNYYFQAARVAEKNKALNELAKMVKFNSDPNWKLVKSQRVVQVDDLGEIVHVQDFTNPTVKKNGIRFRLNGKDAFIYVRPLDGKRHPLVRAMKHRGYDEVKFVKTILEASRMFNNVMRMMITSLDPEFAIRNLVRDAQDAISNVGMFNENELTLKQWANIKVEVSKNLLPSIYVLARAPYTDTGKSWRGIEFSKRLHESWNKAREYGVPMSFRNYEGTEKTISDLQSLLDQMESGPSSKDVMKAALVRLTAVSDILENVSRLSVFDAVSRQMIKNGLDPEEAYTKAAFTAKNVTLNFEKKGAAGSTINALYLFSNAGIQGAKNTLKALMSKRTLGFAGLAASLSFMNRELLYAFMDDDELEKYLFNDQIANNYTLIMNPWDKANPIKMPKSYAAARMAITLGESISDITHGTRSVLNRSVNFGTQMLLILDPIGGVGRGPSVVAPSPVAPLVQAWSNEAWYGGPIRYYWDDPILPDAFEQNSTTIGKSNLLGAEYTKQAQLMYEYTGGMIDVSPTTIEYVTKQYSGGIINSATRWAKMDKGTWSLPISRNFYTKSSDNDRQIINSFIDLADRDGSYTDAERRFLSNQKNREVVFSNLSGSTIDKMILKMAVNDKKFAERMRLYKAKFQEKEKVTKAKRGE